jgi:Fe-S cluster assembly protein SufD
MASIKDHYIKSFEKFSEGEVKNGQGWFYPIRQDAIKKFSEKGFPTTRDEDWRFTNVAQITRTPFRLASNDTVDISSKEVESFSYPNVFGSQFVFVNGRFSKELSVLNQYSNGIKARNLVRALNEDQGSIKEYIARYADYQNDAFTALNTAFMSDGVFVHIPDGEILNEPIHFLYITVPESEPTIYHPRNLIVSGKGSQATLVETHASLESGVYFSNTVTEVVVGENSVVSHYKIERENEEAFHVSTLRVQQNRNSNFTSHSLILGGELVRNNIHSVLSGEGSYSLINCLFMAHGKQHLDNYMKVEHKSPHCDSRQVYKGILDNKSRGVFHGRIVVQRDAQKTDAKQSNKNILLSKDAQMDTKPQLEIYADDVKCTHGATIGQLDENAIFSGVLIRNRPGCSCSTHLQVRFFDEWRLSRFEANWIPSWITGCPREGLMEK